jgi:threonyl-tRNA synthetase
MFQAQQRRTPDLEVLKNMAEENKLDKNDHRQIGKDLDLFVFSELVGPGLPLWTPRGNVIRQELDAFIWQLRSKHNYSRVTIPHITKKELYETSGHWTKFADELFKVTSREGKEYALKPMNCPHHTQIFARKPHSYREMPQRYAETTMVYRDEQSGELGGLTRVLSITQDDSHVFCRHNQIKDEFFKIWDVVDSFYKAFGFSLKVRLSFRDPNEPEKYLGTKEIWDNAENALREIAKERNADSFEGLGEAALYGPKLDFIGTNNAGREWQVATIQLDMNLPERFDLSCTNEKGEKERIVMIHSAIAGSLERVTAILLEHFEGNLPLWLSPTQVTVIPVRDTHNEHARKIFDTLIEKGIRAELNDADVNLGTKVREAKNMKNPYWIVIGDKEIESNKVSIEHRDKGKVGEMTVDELLTLLAEEIREKK